CRQYNSNPLTF
nr:immunoglobulin light chain junction region [Macaca mulatta]MPN82228.1 immunoglobulin light chain junction region [Macaca mulatta]